MELNFTIQYKKGSEIPDDFFSTNVVKSIKISDEDLASLQDKDTSCKSIKKPVARPSNWLRQQDMPSKNARNWKNMIHWKQKSMEKNRKEWCQNQ